MPPITYSHTKKSLMNRQTTTTRRALCGRYAAALALIMAMVFASEQCQEKEFIFPEILALAVGFWVAPRPFWRASRLNIFLAPTLAAVCGVLLMRYSHLPLAAMIVVAYIAVALLLVATRSRLAPAISAAILPLLIGTTSWNYPLAVGVLTGTVALGSIVAQPSSGETPSEEAPFSQRDELIFWGKILPVVAAYAVMITLCDVPFMMAPPLIVMFSEAVRPNNPLARQPFKPFFLVALAASCGVLALFFLKGMLLFPGWLCAALASCAVFAGYETTGMRLPPAAALGLLPLLISPERLAGYAWQVPAGAALFLVIACLIFRPNAAASKKGA